MKKKTITTYFNDDGSKVSETTTETEYDDGVIGVCDGDCESCDDPTLCEDTIELSPVLEGTIEISLLDVINKVLAMIGLGFSAATAIRLWKKTR